MTTRTYGPRVRVRFVHRLYRVTQTSTGMYRSKIADDRAFASMGKAELHARKCGPGTYEVERIRIEGRPPYDTESLVRRKTVHVPREHLTTDEQADLRERVAAAPRPTEAQVERVMARFERTYEEDLEGAL